MAPRVFWHQRLTAVANVPLTIALIVIVIGLMGRNHAAVVQILGSTLVALTMLLFIVTSAYHIVARHAGHHRGLCARRDLEARHPDAQHVLLVRVGLAAVFAILKLSFGL